MDRAPQPGIFGLPATGKSAPTPTERELHALTVAVVRMATALESIANDTAALRKLVERESR